MGHGGHRSNSLVVKYNEFDFRCGPVRSSKLKPTPTPDARAFIPASVALRRLHDEAPTEHFTLGWLMGSLRKRSLGIVMLLLALVAMAPGVSIVASLLLMIPAFQNDRGSGRPGLSTPHRRPSLPDAAPRRSGAASRTSAEIS